MVRQAHMCMAFTLTAVLWGDPALSDAGASQRDVRANTVSDNRDAERSPANPTVYASIEQVDFRNFTFPLSMCVEPNRQTQVAVKNGTFEGQDVLVTIDKEMILYADLTDDKSNEAVVPVYCSPPAANFTNVEIHIYTLRDGKPELLAKLHDDIFAADYKRFYQDNMLWFSITHVEAFGKKLTVYKLADGSHACPKNQVSFDYLWNGRSFVLFDKPTKNPVIDCGHNTLNVTGMRASVIQVEKAREAFWRKFMNEPAIEIANTIALELAGYPIVNSYRLGNSKASVDLPYAPSMSRGRDLITEKVIKLLKFEKTTGLQSVLLGHPAYTVWYRAEFEVIETFTMVDAKPIDPMINIFRIVKYPDRNALMLAPHWIPKGTTFEIQGETLLHLTENGWVSEL
jgi:hypothetical protein